MSAKYKQIKELDEVGLAYAEAVYTLFIKVLIHAWGSLTHPFHVCIYLISRRMSSG
jgi:hypothetical protein